MADERRYGEKEVAAIFRAATTSDESPHRAPSSDKGLTLSELQQIGREVGVAPERIAQAASGLDLQPATHPRRKLLGSPVGVGLTVDLPRAPTDREWELLVSELRRTFHARGREQSHGNLREWTNSNLHAFIEPTEDAYRLRLGTLKGDAIALNRMGAAAIFMSIVLLLVVAVPGGFQQELAGPLFMALIGIFALGYNALRLPAWADERESQMEYIAARARDIIAAE